ncbi:MAG TPA: HNH endonuclease [Desulfuromonadaceae bacterium]|jgi:5-methylcytosine-specific restriction protein A
MTLKLWEDNDDGYELWLSEHPDGFQANVYKRPKPRYFRIHRATCKLPDRSNPDTHNPRTGNFYSKVTADTFHELIAWAKENLPTLKIGEANRCKICTPLDDSPLESEPTTNFSEYLSRANRLQARGRVRRPEGVPKPAMVQTNTGFFFRDPKVRAWILQRAEGRCELCKTSAPFFTEDQKPFLESHHLVALSVRGADTPNNTAALCPNCHRNLHYGKERVNLGKKLKNIVARKEKEFDKPKN